MCSIESRQITKDRHDELVEELVKLRSVINAAEARCAQITVELAAMDDGHPLGCTSTVQFLSWQAGLSGGAARALVTVGERLGELPTLEAAAMSGEVSVWQARAIASAAADDAEAAGLLDIEAGAILSSALDRAADQVPDEAMAGAEDRHAARQADAMAVSPAPSSSRIPTGPPPVRRRDTCPSTSDWSACWTGGPTQSRSTLPTPQIPPTRPPPTTRRGLSCAVWAGTAQVWPTGSCAGCAVTPRFKPVLRDSDGHPLALGRRHRVVNRRLRRALHARDGGRCQAPGCDARRYLHAHHIIPWVEGGPTELPNLVLLCFWHHRMVHDGQLAVTVVDGQPEVTATRIDPIR